MSGDKYSPVFTQGQQDSPEVPITRTISTVGKPREINQEHPSAIYTIWNNMRVRCVRTARRIAANFGM